MLSDLLLWIVNGLNNEVDLKMCICVSYCRFKLYEFV